MIGIEEYYKERKLLHGYLRNIKEVFVEEENLQDYQKRREEEKVRNGKLHRENLLRKLQMWLERSPVDVSGMVC